MMVADLPSRRCSLCRSVVQFRRGGIPGSFGRSVGHSVGPFLQARPQGKAFASFRQKKKKHRKTKGLRGHSHSVTSSHSPPTATAATARLAPFNSYAAHNLKQELFDPLLSLLNRIQPSCPF